MQATFTTTVLASPEPPRRVQSTPLTPATLVLRSPPPISPTSSPTKIPGSGVLRGSACVNLSPEIPPTTALSVSPPKKPLENYGITQGLGCLMVNLSVLKNLAHLIKVVAHRIFSDYATFYLEVEQGGLFGIPVIEERLYIQQIGFATDFPHPPPSSRMITPQEVYKRIEDFFKKLIIQNSDHLSINLSLLNHLSEIIKNAAHQIFVGFAVTYLEETLIIKRHATAVLLQPSEASERIANYIQTLK